MKPECEAVNARRQLTEAMMRAINREPSEEDLDGSQRSLLTVFWELEGIVAEYVNGGDEMAEGCTCHDERLHKDGNKGLSFDQIFQAFKDGRN